MNFSLKMFTIYSAFTILVIVIFSFILLNYQNRNLEKEIYKHNKSLLTQVKIFSDTYLIENVKSQVTEKFLYINQDTSISTFLSSKHPDDLTVFSKTQTELSNIAANSKFINSVYVYRTKDDTLISSGDGVVLSVTDPDNYYKEYFDVNLLKNIMTSELTQNWISPMENAAFYETKRGKNIGSLHSPTISFAQSIPMFSTPEDRIGCVIVNIDENYFSKSLNQIFDITHGNLMIIDSTGRLLAPSSNNSLYKSIKALKQMNPVLTEVEGSVTLVINKRHYALTWIKSNSKDWKYISLVPIDILNKQITVTKRFAFAIILLTIIVSLMCLRFITSILYKPLRNLTKSIKDKLGLNPENVNDLDFIGDAISNLSTKVEEMKDTLDRNINLIENKLANDILYNNYSDEKEIKDRLKLVGKEFSKAQYYVFMTQVNTALLSKLPFEQREFVTYKTIELINNNMPVAFNYINIRTSDNCIVTIVNYDGDIEQTIDLKLLLSILKQELGLNFNIAVSEMTESLSSICGLYNITKKYLRYNYIYGYNNIFTSSYIKNLEANNVSTPANALGKIESMLKSCKANDLEDEIRTTLDNIKQCGYSLASTRTMLLQITTSIGKVSEEYDIEELYVNKLITNFELITSLDEYFSWICSRIDLFNDKFNSRNSAIDHEFILKISKYISENVDAQLSLNSVADAFYISPSHLSKIFKKSTGTNFSEFIIGKKFERAAELLLKNKDMEINELSEKIGYQNISYFTRLFKEKYGMTPLQYRKKHS